MFFIGVWGGGLIFGSGSQPICTMSPVGCFCVGYDVSFQSWFVNIFEKVEVRFSVCGHVSVGFVYVHIFYGVSVFFKNFTDGVS